MSPEKTTQTTATTTTTITTTTTTTKAKSFIKPLLVVLSIGALLIGAFFGVCALLGAIKSKESSQNPIAGTAEPAESVKPSYTLERDADTGRYIPFGSDESKNNSAEAFVEYKTAIISSSDSTAEEKFDAQISLVTLYISLELFDEADKVLHSIDTASLTSSQQETLNNTQVYLDGIREL